MLIHFSGLRSDTRDRCAEVRDNLTARISEAEREGWLGEIENKLHSQLGVLSPQSRPLCPLILIQPAGPARHVAAGPDSASSPGCPR
jgi:hypothetical protein